MKHFAQFTITLAAGLFFSLGGATLNAQEQKESADIPFAFQIDSQTYPAGQYSLSKVANTIAVFDLRDPENHLHFVNARLDKIEEARNPRLVFVCAGNLRILSEIWTDGGQGFIRSQSAIEKSLNHNLQTGTTMSVRATRR